MRLGHLQEAVRQSFEVLQHALQRPSPQPTLLDPLLRPGDQGVREFTPVPDSEFIQSGMEAERMGASPYMAVAGRDALHPRVLDPYPTTPVGPLRTVNPFWSTSLQQAAKGSLMFEQLQLQVDLIRYQVRAWEMLNVFVNVFCFARDVKKPSANAEGRREQQGEPMKLWRTT